MAKLGKYNIDKMLDYEEGLGYYEDNNYVVLSDSYDFVSSLTFSDATSIENWNMVKNKIDYSYTDIRNEITTLVTSIGWNNLTDSEKVIAAENFCVDKVYRDEVLSDDEQNKNIKKMLRTLELDNKRTIQGESDILAQKGSSDVDTYIDSNYTFITPYYYYAEEDAETVTSDVSVEHLVMTLTDIPSGKYGIDWSCEYYCEGNRVMEYKVEIDGMQISHIRADGVYEWAPYSGHKQKMLGGTHTIKFIFGRVDTAIGGSNGAAYVRNLRIKVLRVK